MAYLFEFFFSNRRKDERTDGRTDGQSDYIMPQILFRGIKKHNPDTLEAERGACVKENCHLNGVQ